MTPEHTFATYFQSDACRNGLAMLVSQPPDGLQLLLPPVGKGAALPILSPLVICDLLDLWNSLKAPGDWQLHLHPWGAQLYPKSPGGPLLALPTAQFVGPLILAPQAARPHRLKVYSRRDGAPRLALTVDLTITFSEIP